MKTNFRAIGPAELELKDLGEVLIHWAKKSATNKKELSKMITEYLQEELKMVVHRVQKENDLSKIVVDVEQTQDSGVRYIGSPTKIEEPSKDKKSNKGFKRANTGFYGLVADIIAEYKAKGKSEISFEEMVKEINYDWVTKKGKEMEAWRVKQYLTPSQIKKNAPVALRGVKRAKDDEGLVFN